MNWRGEESEGSDWKLESKISRLEFSNVNKFESKNYLKRNSCYLKYENMNDGKIVGMNDARVKLIEMKDKK